jgi:hypothetical protein
VSSTLGPLPSSSLGPVLPVSRLRKGPVQAFAVVAVGSFVAGCSIIPNDPAKLTLLGAIGDTHADVISTAKSAPAAAAIVYGTLRSDFNGFIDVIDMKVASVALDYWTWRTVDLDISSPENAKAWSVIRDDLTAYDVAAEATPRSNRILSSDEAALELENVVAGLLIRSPYDRKFQATGLREALKAQKLPDFGVVNLKHQ